MMLPRQNKNAFKIDINNEDDAEDIEAKRMQAQKNYGIKDQQQSRELSSDPNDVRNRQQSFSGNSVRPGLNNNLKNSQHIAPVANKAIKQPTPAANVAKVGISNEKKAPIMNVPIRPGNNNNQMGSNQMINNNSQMINNNSQMINNNSQMQGGISRTNSLQVNHNGRFPSHS